MFFLYILAPILLISAFVIKKHRYGGKVSAFAKIFFGIFIFVFVCALALSLGLDPATRNADTMSAVLLGVFLLYAIVQSSRAGFQSVTEGAFHLKVLAAGDRFTKEKLRELKEFRNRKKK